MTLWLGSTAMAMRGQQVAARVIVCIGDSMMAGVNNGPADPALPLDSTIEVWGRWLNPMARMQCSMPTAPSTWQTLPNICSADGIHESAVYRAAVDYKAATGCSHLYVIYLAVPGTDVVPTHACRDWSTTITSPGCTCPPPPGSPATRTAAGMWPQLRDHYLHPALADLALRSLPIDFGGVLFSLGNNMGLGVTLPSQSDYHRELEGLIAAIRQEVGTFALQPPATIAAVGVLGHLYQLSGAPPHAAGARAMQEEWLRRTAPTLPRRAVDLNLLLTIPGALPNLGDPHPNRDGHRAIGARFAIELATANMLTPATVIRLL